VEGRSVEKTYLALCHGALPPAGRLDTAYGRHPRDRTRYTGRVRAGRRAITEWRTLEVFGGEASLVEVTLHTGRTHQIRVHLAEAGHPLLADPVYGGTRREARLAPGSRARRAAEAIGRQALHAARLAFDHPRSGERVVVEAPLPADFAAALGALRS
jgi:23S rRNA pseudouridine1911/1915/1917 synthase